MSKTFDNVLRNKLINILRSKGVPEWDLSLIRLQLTDTTLKVKAGRQQGDSFSTNKEVPQEDGLSRKLFTVYLDEELKELEKEIQTNSPTRDIVTVLHGNNYHKKPIPSLPSHVEIADDVDFICSTQEEADEICKLSADVLARYNLCVNQQNTEIFQYHKDTDLRKIKKLGTILDEGAEISRRKHLTRLAMSKFRRIWKNKFLNVKTKMCIYNVYVTSILLYPCSTWYSNSTIAKGLYSFHRRQLRACLDIHYPKVVKNEKLYYMTRQTLLSEHIAKQRTGHLGHIQHQIYPIRDLPYHIHSFLPKRRAKANILKPYEAELESNNIRMRTTRALAKRL
ncbi:uncharacterized protein LOC142335053 [Convolutriloba macropyga]|uniref:uncharacterized protein LOC142335053 n=1 Tax=Convolutriloba macropyga TaxID=536237 RepID=UPI003F52640A